MKAKPPLLSIVVPSYNQGRFIGETLAEPTRYPEIEIIVMDGGSTDQTCNVIRSFGDAIDHWVSEKDDGQADAINRGLNCATGTWVAFQNSDDFYVDGALGDVLDVIRADPAADLLVGGCHFADVEGRPFRSTLPRPIWTLPHARLNFLQNQALFVRRTYGQKVGWLRKEAQFCLDYEWFLRLLRNKPRIRLIKRYVGVQRYHEDTKTAQNQAVHDREFRRFSRLHFRWFERVIAVFILPIYRAYRLVLR